MNRVEEKLLKCEAEHRGGLIVEIPMLSPTPQTQLETAELLVKAGVDVIQIPIPVRFPWMYGERILKIQKMAREADTHYKHSFAVLEELVRRYPNTEFMPVGFYGGLQRMGQQNYVNKVAELGIQIVDVPDYPLVHDQDPRGLMQALREKGIAYATVISTDVAMAEEGTKAYEHFEAVVKASEGFCFLLAAAGGKTGEKKEMDYRSLEHAENRILKVQEKVGRRCPIVAVCGISTPEQVSILTQELGMHVMFGSALFTRMMNGESNEEIYQFLVEMKNAAVEKR